MKKNMGLADRLLRIAVGTSILALTVAGPQSPWALLGLVPLLTGLVGSCPLYSIVGCSTRQDTHKADVCEIDDASC